MTPEYWKTQTWWSLPVYTGDVSGVCSALYELGGMVVMHDPSGCNSTYNTHDEVRWTDMESLIFLSGLTQLDAITGNDQKLVDDIVSAARRFQPAFIAIANSPIPWLIGTDFDAVCRKVTNQCQIRTFHVETNAMHDYTKGAGGALLHLAKMLFDPSAKEQHTQSEANGRKLKVNVLGMTPLDFTVRRDAYRLRQILEEEGFEVISVWAMGDSLSQLKASLQADVNLVVSSTGIDTAGWMEETYGIPYTAGIPIGAFSEVLFQSLRQCAAEHVSKAAYLEILNENKMVDTDTQHVGSGAPEAALGGGQFSLRCTAGEPVIMGSIAADKILRESRPCSLIPLTETVQGLVPDSAPCPAGEQQIRDILGRYKEVTADPMLRGACRSDCRFEAMPHFALSGRMYLDRIRPLFGA